ncbi:MAG: DUF2752 domain-containing protein [Bacteroidales bacterium]|nr:DUF2752 domain-containing protein [Bacteroidales bacterium]
MTPGGRSRIIVAVVAVAAVVAMVALYSRFDPTSTWWMPRCPSKMITGFDCPGCGSQRAIHALLHGDVAGAVRYNFMIFPAMTMVALLLVAQLGRHRWRAMGRMHNLLNSTPVILTVLVVMIVWWVVRNIFWPV